MRGIKAQVVADIPQDATAVLYLSGLRAIARSSVGVSILKAAFHAARIVAANQAAQPVLFVTVQDTGGNFGLDGVDPSHAFAGGLPGLVKTAALEWPESALKAIDLQCCDRSASDLAQALEQELLRGGIDGEVGLRADGTRIVLECVAHPLHTGLVRNPVGAKSVWLVSGGARGVTAACVRALAQHTQGYFVLLGRTERAQEPAFCQGINDESGLRAALYRDLLARGVRASPAEVARTVKATFANREITATLAALASAGAACKYVNVDTCDKAALAKELATVRSEWGPITGIIHGAGVLADKFIADKTDQQFDAVLRTKVDGACALLEATADDPLTHIVFFSSIAARCGNAGQCDYAMANEVLNKLAAAQFVRRSGQTLVKAINWGPWDGGMVGQDLKSHFDRLGIPLIEIDVGARFLVEEILYGGSEHVEVVIAGGLNNGAWRLKERLARARFDVLLDHNGKVVAEADQLETFYRS